MFGDFFDTQEDIIYGRGEQVLSSEQCKPKNCAGYLNLPPLKRKQNQFIGLKNQGQQINNVNFYKGATCYLNSLIQSLFLSPEFRSAIFKLKLCVKLKNNDDKSQRNEIFSEGKFVILFALQQLLAEMQSLDCSSVSTENMTKSFGWQEDQNFPNMEQQQQDVQEAQRVLFDVLNRALANTEYAQLISSQYEGVQANHITCLECNTAKETPEAFYDLLLQVKGFENLVQSIQSYITPELLTGNNQYFCETCQKKVDANKGIKILKFPNILTISLNRYDFDQKTWERIKINDKFTFELELDCNKFLNAQEYNENKDLKYELFAVLIHRGNAFGGHYHAYIRSLMNESNWKELMDKYNSDQKKLNEQKRQQEKLKEANNQMNIECDGDGESTEKECEFKEKQKQESKVLIKHSKRTKKGKKSTKLDAESKKIEEQKQIEKIFADENFDDNDFPFLPTNPKLLENWFDFNDSTVTAISVNRLQKQFGGSSESAYILVYRKASLSTKEIQQPELSFKTNAQQFCLFRMPSYIKSMIQQSNEAMEKERVEYQELSQHIEMYFIDINNFQAKELKLVPEFDLEKDGIKIKFKLNTSLLEVFTLLQAIYNIEESDLMHLKIIEIEEQKNTLYHAIREFKYNSNDVIMTLEQLNFTHLSKLLVDFSLESDIYLTLSLVIGEDCVPIKIKIRSGNISKMIIAHWNMTLNELKLILQSLFQIEASKQLIYVIEDQSQKNVDFDEKTLKELRISEDSNLLLAIKEEKKMEIEEEINQKENENFNYIFMEFEQNNETIVERASNFITNKNVIIIQSC